MGWQSTTAASRYIYVTVTASVAAVAGVKRSREMAFIEAGALPLAKTVGTFVSIRRSDGLTEAVPT